MTLREGVVNDPPVPTRFPPTEASYQKIGSAAVALRVIGPVSHLDECVTTGFAEAGLIVAVAAVLGPPQPALKASA